MTELVLALKITADGKELKAAAADARKDLNQLGSEATEAAASLTATSTAADRLAASEKTAAAATQGLAGSQAKATAAAAAQAAAFQRQTQEAARYGMSLGQLQQAQRQLPMQITDIVTSLASGMPVYMVAVQQGGQLRDSFGGVGNASRALLGAIKPMYLGIAAGVAVVAGIGAAFLQTYQEMQEYERGLISTGNITGVTSGRLGEITDQVGAATGEFGNAQAAVTKLAESGKLMGSQLSAATTTAVNLALLTGQGIEQTTSDIIKLAAAPTKHLVELNERYHFLTLATYEQVRALEAQGKNQDAVAVGLAELQRVTDERVKQMESRAGSLERAWKSVADTISSAWQAAKDFGRTDDEYLLRTAKERLSQAEQDAKQGGTAGARAAWRVNGLRAEVQALEERIAATNKVAETEAATQRAADEVIRKREQQEKAATEARQRAARERASEAKRIREAADTEIASAQRQVALGKEATEVARVQYEIDHGIYRQLDAGRQAALLHEAARLDAAKASQQAGEDYEKLLGDIQTKEERLTKQMMQRLTVLDAARARGAVHDADYNQAAARIVDAGFTDAPKIGRIQNGDTRNAVAEQERWYEQQLQLLAEDRARRADLNTEWNAKEQDLQRQHQAALAEIAKQSSFNYDAMWSRTFDRFTQGVGEATAAAMFHSRNLADGLRSLVLSMGQQVVATLVEIGVKRLALILLDKTAATTAAAGYVAAITSQSATQTAMAGLNAFASTAAIPVVGPALAPAAAAAATAAAGTLAAVAVSSASGGVIAGMAHDGIARVPAANEGTWLLKKDEMVLNPAQADSFGTLLSFVRSQQQAAQGGTTGGAAGGGHTTIILRNESGQALEARETGRQRVGDEERIEIALTAKRLMVQDIAQRGEAAQVFEGIYGLGRRGR